MHIAALTVRYATVLVECEALRCEIAAVWHQYCMFIVKKVDLSRTVLLCYIPALVSERCRVQRIKCRCVIRMLPPILSTQPMIWTL